MGWCVSTCRGPSRARVRLERPPCAAAPGRAPAPRRLASPSFAPSPPSYMTSSPIASYPSASSASPMASTVVPQKGRRVALLSPHRRQLPQQHLQQHPDRHPRRQRVRVDQDVRHHPPRPCTACPPRPRCSPITPFCPILDENLSPMMGVLVVRVLTLSSFDPSGLTLLNTRVHHAHVVPHDGGLVALDRLAVPLQRRLGARRRHRLADEHVARAEHAPHRHHPRRRELVVVAPPRSPGHLGRRLGRVLEALAVRAVGALLLPMRRVLDRAEEPALERRPVEDDRVLLVAPAVAHDRDDAVDAAGRVGDAQQRVGPRGDERPLRLAEHVRYRVHAPRVVEREDPQRLLAHGALVGVPRRLIVIGQRGSSTRRRR